MSDPRTRIVEEGYDAIADVYLGWIPQISGDPRRHWADALVSRLRDGQHVLELGCGAGVPETKSLAERFRVTAVDISGEQIERARKNVPSAEFIRADFTRMELEPASFDAVAAFYSFNHVPRDLLAGLFARIHTWLVPGGLFLVSLGTGDTDDSTEDWLGTTMFFSSFPPETNRQLLREAGFEFVRDELVTMHEPEPDGKATFQWVLARR